MLSHCVRYLFCVVFLGFAIVIAFPGFAGTASTGEELFQKRCGGCHALGRDKEGPRLQKVYGRVAGSVDTFQYSGALKESKIVWGDKTLNAWLTDPEELAPGNDMSFHVESADERRQIIDYLKKNSN